MAEQEVAEVQRSKRRNRLIFGILILILVPICILLFIFLPGLIFPPGAPTTPPESDLPVADANGPYTADEGQPIVFDGSASTGQSLTYGWDFGDGTTGDGVAPNHTYANGPADLVVMLTVTDDQGRTSQSEANLTVNNLPPVAEPGGPYEAQLGQTVALFGSCTDPGLSDTCTIEWRDAANEILADAMYTCPDTETEDSLSLTAMDNDGATNTVSVSVTCSVDAGDPNQPPGDGDDDSDNPGDGDDDSDTPGDGDDDSDSPGDGDDDPDNPGDGDDDSDDPTALEAAIAITLRSKNGLIFKFDGSGSTGAGLTYAWDLGDGSTADTAEVLHEYATKDTYTVTLTITDENGATDVEMVTVP